MLRERKGDLEGSHSQKAIFPDLLRTPFISLSVRDLVVSSVENFIEFTKQSRFSSLGRSLGRMDRLATSGSYGIRVSSEKLRPVGSSEGHC